MRGGHRDTPGMAVEFPIHRNLLKILADFIIRNQYVKTHLRQHSQISPSYKKGLRKCHGEPSVHNKEKSPA